jgi:hypothetical protein
VYGELSELVEQGAIGADFEATYPLDQFQEVLRHAQKNARTGKVLFIPNGAPEGAFTMQSLSSRQTDRLTIAS